VRESVRKRGLGGGVCFRYCFWKGGKELGRPGVKVDRKKFTTKRDVTSPVQGDASVDPRF